ncbi:probable inactive 1-aminocyclopropane-1-carboxylate synthase-like protein 2 [Pomacea canaliculata]|uniref:probable inactive 1-aminocyclopropane-1-carboxylate synthase-like protein 2 n=1 Tax=Pomacea canaliculata TaxID=400727 RepID=UPI000D734D60|nr:probable inactive 1-aminocyclopropane-1-carboxylate synthase-like protein 2 [Pomacea canaliculata]
MGLAENRLCQDITTEKLRSLDLSIEAESSLQYYPNLKGLPSFRRALASFIDRRFRPRKKIDPEQLIVASGTTAILDTLALSLAEAGDYIMVPAPYYYRIRNDLEDRAGVHVLEVPLSSKAGFELTVKSFEIVHALARRQGKKVRGMILINPNNPLGDVYSQSFLIECLHFAFKHGLHVIADEIYALSVFDESTKFFSILSLPIPDPQRVHFIWGASKDLGLSGYRCGVLHTRNRQVLEFATAVGIFQLTPPLMQRRLEHIISDDDWLDKVYFPTYHTRLTSVHRAACAKLAAMGVKVHPSKAGIFLWADFSPFLSEPTFAAEHALFERFLDARVYVMPGNASYCPTPGWFRLIIASEKNQVLEGLHRIEHVLLSLPLEKLSSSWRLF